MQKFDPIMTRREMFIAAAAGACVLSTESHSQERGGRSIRDRLESEARTQTKMNRSLRRQLEDKAYLAVHTREEEYPEPEDYEDYEKNEPEIKEVVIPEDLPANVTVETIDPDGIQSIVQSAAEHYRVDRFLVFGMIRQESNFKIDAVSPAGARGLMQLMPGTASDMGVKDPFDPVQNVMGGTQYIALMLKYFKRDVTLALAGYNAGPGNVRKYGGVPPFEETQHYVVKVQRYQHEFTQNGVNIQMSSKRGLIARDALPNTTGSYYKLTLVNGMTQPVEVLVDSGDYYLTQYKGHATRLPKSLVAEIQEAN